MTPYDDMTLSAARRILDCLDAEIDRAISYHDAELEDYLYAVKRTVFHMQAKRLIRLHEQQEAKAG